MSRKKGIKKTGGRTKGTPNKSTEDFRNFVKELLSDNMDKIKTDIEKIEPEKRLMFFEKILSYVLPKMATVEIKEEPPQEVINITYKDFV